MASVLLVVLIGFCINAADATDKFVKINCQSESHGVYGQHSMLKCIVEPISNATIIVVTWKKDNNLLLLYQDSPKPTPGIQFAEPHWDKKNMNVSLLLTNTKMADAGVYECMVITDIGTSKATTHLSVTAKYQEPTMNSSPEENIKQNTDVTIFCHSKGGHQKGSIRWFDQWGTNWTSSAELVVANQTGDGLFSLSSKYTVLKATSSSSQYNCTVHNARGVKEGEATIHLQFEPEGRGMTSPGDTTKIVAPLLVIGALIVGLLLALLVCRRRTLQARRPSAAPLMSRDHDRINTGDPDA